MSDFRVAVVAEGPTDLIVIEAALRALLSRPFVLTSLQPEPTRPKVGTGWGGVLRWCLDFATRGSARFEDDPILPGFDLFVVHIDADVADKRYADVSEKIADLAAQRGWPLLPDPKQCPPPSESADVMRACLRAWTGMAVLGPKTVLCVPSKSVDAWLAAAVLEPGHSLLTGLECNPRLDARLQALPKPQRMRKTEREYRVRERTITARWADVRQCCTLAEQFSNEVDAILRPIQSRPPV